MYTKSFIKKKYNRLKFDDYFDDESIKMPLTILQSHSQTEKTFHAQQNALVEFPRRFCEEF